MLYRCLALLCWSLGGLAIAALPAAAAERVALVIGNSAYQNVARLATPANDADAMGAMFRNAGYAVTEAKDLGNREFNRVVRDFSVKAAGADLAVVYFSGHGIAVQGINYLIPIDARLESEYDVRYEAVSLDDILAAIARAKQRMLIIDASRSNRFVSTTRRSVFGSGAERGLSRMDVDRDTLVAFAARPESVAEDGGGS
jgi:uncharacterized caspase-like protein